MKLQQLTIHNIASIEDAVIDFEASPLASSEVFLITGKTGAGKSTILDAICLALYADTPRLEATKMEGGTKDGDNNVKIDDPRQLMRRNTGEAFVTLTFTGNNGTHYKATWAVTRAYKKPTGNLQPKEWCWENLDDTNAIPLRKDVEIKAEIKTAIGLDFDQFCRTTLLAQGEFTRFLNSKDEEKAKILEKITGVDVYSKIGVKVYETTSKKKQAWETAQQMAEGTHTLTDEEIALKQEEIKAFETQYESCRQQLEKDKEKRQWLKTDDEYKTKQAIAMQEYEQVVKVVESDAFKAKERLVKLWNETIEARRWLTAKKEAENNKTELQKQLTHLHSEYMSVLSGYAFAKQERLATEAERNKLPEIDPQEEAQATLHLNELHKQRDSAKELSRNIATVFERIELHSNEKQRKMQAAKVLDETLVTIEKKRGESTALEPLLREAKLKMDTCKELYDKQSDTINKFAQTLRQKLKTGDICPVCRQQIKNELPHEDELALLVGSLKDAFTAAETSYNDLLNRKNKIEAETEATTQSYQTGKQALDQDKSVAIAKQKVVEACMACGIMTLDENTPRVLETLKANTETSLKGLETSIPELEKKVLSYQKISRQRRSLDVKLSDMNSKCQMAKEAIEDIQLLLPDWRQTTQPLHKPSTDLVRKTNDVKNKVTTTLAQLKQSEDTINDSSQRIETFLNTHHDIDAEQLSTLNNYTSQAIAEINSRLEAEKNNVLTKKTLMDEAVRKLDEHRLNKPKLGEDDVTETLDARISASEKSMEEIAVKRGAVSQELKADQENKLRLSQLIDDAEKKKADYQKWSRMNQLIGDSTGNKFRKIAQSYVLSSLIHSANSYMKTLTDRYTLKVTPGTFVISIEDAYQGYVTRAASTISGGESFLVSLALALALSDIGQQLAVDTLFIDEGFGTLSGEPLQNAVNTLRSLHTKSGRHVGIISHVEELKERIPVQIQVVKQGEGRSKIVITNA